MARRVKSRKRKYLGNRSYGGGNAKNRRGKGNRGGVGRAGWHKHKWLATIKRGEHISRKYGFHSPREKPSTLTLSQIASLISEGRFQQKEGTYHINLPSTRVVNGPGYAVKALITAAGFSASAKQLIEKHGGTAKSTAKPKKQKKSPAPVQAPSPAKA